MSTPQTDNAPATPLIRRHRAPSVVWLLPFLAAIIAGWLVIKSYQDAGIIIEVQFDTAEGLEAGVTRVMYRGLPTGKIKTLKLNDDLKSVTAVIEMEKAAAEILVEGSRFWLVKPQISLSGVKGLDTLLSGYYIELQPGKGKERYSFIADNEPPPPLKDRKGLYISLLADSAQSIQRGAKVYYRQIEVGEVINFGLTDSSEQIRIELFIEPSYSHLVTDSTRFWNASGISLKANLSRVDLRFGSLAAIIAGGISFYTPPDDDSILSPDHQFHLFADFEAAEDGIVVNVKFPARSPVHEGTRVISEGIQIGRVQSLELSEDLTTLNTRLLIDPRARPLLRSGSHFWLPKPKLSLNRLQNIGDLIQGSAIVLQPGTGEAMFNFTALSTPPAYQPSMAGLNIRLQSDRLGSLDIGSPVTYRQIPVGEVNGYELNTDGSGVQIYATIQEQYADLVKHNSRFWEESGIRVKAGVDGVELQSGSLTNVINGGIAFFTPDTRDQTAVEQAHRFHLFKNFDNASNQGRLLYQENADKLAVRLKADELGSITSGAPVLYKQLTVGSVSHYALSEDDSVTIYLLIDKPYRHLVTDQSRFWNASGVDASLSRNGVEVRTESLQTLLRGGIAFANLSDNGNAAEARQFFKLYNERTKALQKGPDISITFPPGPNITVGANVYFKGLVMGKVEQVRLLDSLGSAETRVALTEEGKLLAHQGSRFWIAAPRVTLSGVDNPATLIMGNHIEALPGNGAQQLSFTGLPESPAERNLPGLNIVLQTKQLGAIDINSNIYFRGMPVGYVSGYDLSDDNQTVKLFVNIKERYRKLINKTSRFWNIGGIDAEFGLFKGLKVETTNLESLVQGGIAFSTPDPDSQPVNPGYQFELYEQEPDK